MWKWWRAPSGRVAFKKLDACGFERGPHGGQLSAVFARQDISTFDEVHRSDADKSPHCKVAHRPTKNGARCSNLCSGNHVFADPVLVDRPIMPDAQCGMASWRR